LTAQAFASFTTIGKDESTFSGRLSAKKAAMSRSKHIDPQLLEAYRAPSGETITALCADRPLLLVFLRHFG